MDHHKKMAAIYRKQYREVLNDLLAIIDNVVSGKSSFSTTVINGSMECKISSPSNYPTVVVIYRMSGEEKNGKNSNGLVNCEVLSQLTDETVDANSLRTIEIDTISENNEENNVDEEKSLSSENKESRFSNDYLETDQIPAKVVNNDESINNSETDVQISSCVDKANSNHVDEGQNATEESNTNAEVDENIRKLPKLCLVKLKLTKNKKGSEGKKKSASDVDSQCVKKHNSKSKHRKKVSSVENKRKYVTETVETFQPTEHKAEQTNNNVNKEISTNSRRPLICSDVKNSPDKIRARKKQYKCEYCEKTFSEMFSKKYHERRHTGERPYKCRYCNKAFANSGSRRSHEKTHSGERPYQCSFCDKSFSVRRVKICHERVHTGEKPFPCRYCGKKFKQRSNVMYHERTHTGEKPYSCKYCTQKFNRFSNKERHEERIHKR